MTLVEALREIAPVEGPPRVRARRSEAAHILYNELHMLAGKMWRTMDECDREDVASTVLLRLMNNGPQGARLAKDAGEEAARAYLRAAVRNGLASIARARHEPLDPASPTVKGGPEQEAALREARARVTALEHELFQEIVPRVAAAMKTSVVFLNTLQQLRDLRVGLVTIDDLVAMENNNPMPERISPSGSGGGQGQSTSRVDEAAYRRARNRLDQRFSRVFARLDEEIERLHADGRLDAERAAELRAVLASLRLRQ